MEADSQWLATRGSLDVYKRMLIQGGDLNSNVLQVEGSYFDLLNLAWPRDRYTADKAPGVKYQ